MNLPNKISTLRIMLIPIMVAFYLLPFAWSKLVAAIIFVVAACTDFVDGYIARSRNMVTDLGKFLDPIADKCLLLAALVLLIVDGTIVTPYAQIIAIVILGRELIISAFRQVAALKNFAMAADKSGKIKTIFQDVSLALFMLLSYLHNGLNFSISGPVYALAILSYALLVIATILTITSAINYIVKHKEVLVQPKSVEISTATEDRSEVNNAENVTVNEAQENDNQGAQDEDKD